MPKLRSKTFDITERPLEFTNIYKFQSELDNEALYKKEIFVDSSDFVSIILGVNDHYKSIDEFNTDKFQNNMTMLHSLIYNNYLGPVKLLNPHMHEFIESGIATDPRTNKKLSYDDFEDIAYNLGLDIIDKKDIENKAFSLLYPFTRIHDEVDTIFKSMYLIHNDHPKKRTIYLIDKKQTILSFDTDADFNVPELTDLPIFKKLYESLNKQRQNKSVNNFNDALALCQLQKKLENVNTNIENGVKTIPLLYARKHIKAVVDEISNDKELFKGDERPFIFCGISGKQSIVQTEDFFILDALYKFRKILFLILFLMELEKC
jgi:hypothetical protein